MPLGDEYIAWYEGISDQESLEEYLARLPPARSEAEKYFLSHVLYEHADNFMDRFPWFGRESCFYEFREVTAAWTRDNVDCEYDLSDWDHLYDQYSTDPYWLPTVMKNKRTWPAIPVIFQIEDAALIAQEAELPLSPNHLIEGTHRFHYLRRMILDGTIPPQSPHTVLVLIKKG